MSTVVNLASSTAAVGKRGLLWLGGALLVLVGLLGPATPWGQVALWYVLGGPPLDFDAPRDGQVIAHIDVLGRIPPDISRIRITNTTDGGAECAYLSPCAGHSLSLRGMGRQRALAVTALSVVAIGGSEAGVITEAASPTVPSWNQIGAFLRQMAVLRIVGFWESHGADGPSSPITFEVFPNAVWRRRRLFIHCPALSAALGPVAHAATAFGGRKGNGRFRLCTRCGPSPYFHFHPQPVEADGS